MIYCNGFYYSPSTGLMADAEGNTFDAFKFLMPAPMVLLDDESTDRLLEIFKAQFPAYEVGLFKNSYSWPGGEQSENMLTFKQNGRVGKLNAAMAALTIYRRGIQGAINSLALEIATEVRGTPDGDNSMEQTKTARRPQTSNRS